MFYKTSDIQIAALIYAEGISLIGTDNSNPRRISFVFNEDKRIDELVKGFWNETHKITPRKYMGAFKELKNKLYE